MPIYSFGVDSPLKFELSEEYVALYNRATQAFFDAQNAHLKTYGTPWSPAGYLMLEMTAEELAAFNAFNGILQEALAKHGRPVHESDLHEDFLVKN